MPTGLADRTFAKWLKDLQLSDAQKTVLTTNIIKMETWWAKQPAEALETIQKVAVMMGIPVTLLSKNFNASNLIKVLTAAISMTNWLAPLLRRKLKHKWLQSCLQVLHSMILVISILTPFTMASTICLFQGFRIIQTRMMVLAVIHGLRPNQKLKAILEGCANLNHLWGSSLASHNLFSQAFFLPQCVYIRSMHIINMQPKFYIGSAMHHTLDREHSRSKKFSTQQRQASYASSSRTSSSILEGAQQPLYVWAPIPLFVGRADYRCLELALVQEWQPGLNYPFIRQFFHPWKGILKRPAMNTDAQFGLATLWRRAKHKFTAQVVKDILVSDRFQNRLEPWTITAIGSNTKARFEQTKMLSSSSGGLTLCYALRRLGNNIQEPYLTLSLQAIDASIRWWHGKLALRASALKAP